jgi:type I restriction enzyme S subunit
MATEYVDQGIPFLRSQNVRPFDIDRRGLLYIGQEFHRRLRKSELAAGDVVVVRTGYPGTASVVPDDLDGANCADLVVITPSDHLNPHFLAGLFNSVYGQRAVKSQLVGSAQQHFNIGSAKTMRVRLPDRAGQDRIAEVLGSINALIRNNRRRVQVLEDMARAAYREWFVRFRYPGHESVPLVETVLGPIPEGWLVGSLDGIATVSKASVDPATVDPDTPAVGLEHIPRHQVTLDNWGTAGSQGSRKAVFEKGDVLFGKIRPYFHKVSVAPVAGICSTDVVVIRPHAAHWGQAVFAAASVEFVAHATQTSNGTKMPRADWKVLGKWPLAVPPVHLGEAFSDVARRHLALAETLMFENRRLIAMRDLLLPKLVTGQVDVSTLYLDRVLEDAVA